ncbi:transmembrane protein 272-like [Haliotis rubra]|uniref:transmembrane protein 272-like n=1 Tax=Haliotis rubra TaxID=36100 RepID=UPI001EE5FCAF|nr:transmembrane protein 272-like [Haliotis rubra]
MGSIFDSCNTVSEKCGKGGSVICNVIGTILPIAMISVGAIHIDDCPAQKYICIYLIVAGAFAILVTGVRYLESMCCSSNSGTPPLPILVVNGVLGLFLLSWFIAGNVWVYGLYGKYNPTDKTADNYCKELVYVFAFWIITTGYILLGVYVLLVCFVACCCRRR